MEHGQEAIEGAGQTPPAGEERLLAALARLGMVLYCAAFACYLVEMLLEITNVSSFPFDRAQVREALRTAALALLVAKLVLAERATAPQWVACALLVALGRVTYVVSANDRCFWLFMFVASGQGVRLRSLVRVQLAVLVLWFAVTASLWGAGVIEHVTWTRADGTLRYSLGFGHPNSLAMVLLMICTACCALRFGRCPGPELALIAGAVAVCVLVANSRTSALVLCLLAALDVLFYLLRERPAPAGAHFASAARSGRDARLARLRALAIGVLMLVALGCVAVSYAGMVAYSEENALLTGLDSLLSGRIRLAHQFFTDYGLSLFGVDYSNAPVLSSDGTRFLVDNAYCHVLLRYGVPAACVYVFGIGCFYADALRRGRWDASLLAMTTNLVFGLAEVNGLVFCYNVHFLALSELLFRERGSRWRAVSVPELVLGLLPACRRSAA